MKMCGRYIPFFLLILCCSCSSSDDAPSISIFSASFDFSVAQDGWEGDFTDLPSSKADSTLYELKFAYTNLPSNLGSHKSLMLSGINHSDDLFMFIKRKITGLIPNTSYNVVFEVELASNAPKGYVGIGGAPGESVFLKAGASEIEPRKFVQSEQYVLNLDKGNQSVAGENAIVLGDISIDSMEEEYKLISRSNASVSSSSSAPFIARSNNEGEIWLMVGTESGFEGTTTVYYTKVNVVFSASN